jgi:DNA-binding Xre family transcriptional regulator
MPYVIFPRVIAYRIPDMARARGITTAYQLQMAMNITPNTAYRWWRGEFKSIETETIDRLCEFFDCEPGDIIVRVKNGKAARSRPAKPADRS